VARIAVFAAILCASACGKPPTTALIRIDASPRVMLAAVYGRVALGSAAPGAEQPVKMGHLQLPGTIDVWLPDVAEAATITLRAVSVDGQPLLATANIQIVPHREVLTSVTLLASGPIGGGDDGGSIGPSGDDGGAPGDDLAGGTLDTPDLATATPPAPDMATSNVIAADTFHRSANQALWGTASDGHLWSSSADDGTYAIANNIGLIVGNSGNATAELGPAVADADLVVTGSISAFANQNSGNNELAAMLRWNSDNNFYKAGIDGQMFRLFVRTSANSSTTLSTISYPANPNTSYSIRIRAVGTGLEAKVWPSASAEPATWLVSASDASIASGKPGMRLVFNTASTASFTSFIASKP
jgi:hypothetical protein